jgi:hypothetical protein
LLAQTPGLKEEFDYRLQVDPEFAAAPRARLEFFLRRHSSWDAQLNLYPVFRVDERLATLAVARG